MVVDRPARGRGPGALRPFAAGAWFLRLWLRSIRARPGCGEESCDDQ